MRLLLALIVSLFFSIAPASAIPVFGEDSTVFDSQAPHEADNEPVRLLIDPAFRNSTQHVGEPITFRFITDGLRYQPDEATSLPLNYANNKREANAGHFHAYASILDDTFKTTNVFLGANAFTQLTDNEFAGTITLPEPGEYLLYLESQYDDHTSRIRPHPQQIGAWDAVNITAVVPEPKSAILFCSGVALVAAGRWSRK